MYFLDAVDNMDEDLGGNGDIMLRERRSKTRRVTRVELNRRARHKELLKAEAEAEAKKIENISKEIDCLPDIMKPIGKEDEEKQRRHVGHIISRQERIKSGPPRLGKHKSSRSKLLIRHIPLNGHLVYKVKADLITR